MKRSPRLALAALALGLSAVAGREPPPAPPREQPPQAGRALRETLPQLEFDKLRRERVGLPRGDPFAPLRPAVRAKRSEPPAVAAPAAPPVPWRYLGTLIDEGGTSVYLIRGEEPVRASAGATLAGEYRVEEVTASAITLLYLPLGTRHSLAIAGRE